MVTIPTILVEKNSTKVHEKQCNTVTRGCTIKFLNSFGFFLREILMSFINSLTEHAHVAERVLIVS